MGPIIKSIKTAAMNAYWDGSPTEKTFQFVASEMMLYDQSQANLSPFRPV